jgi:hypothetical protein
MPAGLTLAEAAASRIPGLGWLAEPLLGATGRHYWAVWVAQRIPPQLPELDADHGGVVTVSLTVGTLAGYALARTKSILAFWLLITALIFRALPHSVLVTGYLPPVHQQSAIADASLGRADPRARSSSLFSGARRRSTASPGPSSRFSSPSTSPSRSGCCDRSSRTFRRNSTRRPGSMAARISKRSGASSCR